LLKFAVLVGDEAKQAIAQLGDKAGLIEVDVFEEAEAAPGGADEMQISARGLRPRDEHKARASYASLRKALLKSAGLKTTTVAKREVIVPDKGDASTADDLKVVKFESRLVGGLSIKVLPKEESSND
jgi:hypothetical protein